MEVLSYIVVLLKSHVEDWGEFLDRHNAEIYTRSSRRHEDALFSPSSCHSPPRLAVVPDILPCRLYLEDKLRVQRRRRGPTLSNFSISRTSRSDWG
jgi:hypothetical protein